MYQLLLVEDEITGAELLAQTYDWESMGFSLIKIFSSAGSAMEYIKQNPVDALITDIKMPLISGLELAKFCYEEYPNIGVILYTAYRDFEYAQQGIRYNVVDYLVKPVHDDDLTAAMNKLRRHLQNQQQTIDRPSEYSYNMITQAAVDFIKAHYHESISIEDVAHHVLMSPKYFGAYFKKSCGKNFVDFLREVRVSAAAELLKDEALTISAIAEKVGYKSATHFYKFFQDCYGQTPAQYRKALFSKKE